MTTNMNVCDSSQFPTFILYWWIDLCNKMFLYKMKGGGGKTNHRHMDSQIWTRRPVVGSSQLRGWPCGRQWMLDQTVKNSRQPGVRWSLSQSEINVGGVEIKNLIYIYTDCTVLTEWCSQGEEHTCSFRLLPMFWPSSTKSPQGTEVFCSQQDVQSNMWHRSPIKVKGKILIWRGTGTTERRKNKHLFN